MTEEEQRRYIDLGLRADISTKANAVQAAINTLENAFHRASGMYVPSRFAEPVSNLQRAMSEFTEAMAKKEAFGYADQGEVDPDEAGDGAARGPVPVREDQTGAAAAKEEERVAVRGAGPSEGGSTDPS